MFVPLIIFFVVDNNW